ncbi:MAG: hypothetical protein AAGA48_28875 [Myxococcota bacterium]
MLCQVRPARGPHGPAFYPDLPFTPGLSYTVASGDCTANVTIPATKPFAPHVVGVFPSAGALPENVLRFYVTFSQPMAEGNFLSHLRLERLDTGEDLTGVFFDNIHELWSADRRRITLLVDPGRVKTGLVAHNELGRAFAAGGHYRLHILPTWTSVAGAPLESSYVHDFRAVEEDRERVRPGVWTLHVPDAGTRAPLGIDFGEPVDHVSVHRLVRIRAPNGTLLEGQWRLGPGERTAEWTPVGPWMAPIHDHRLVVSGRFEDIAGNNLNAAMDHEMDERRPGDEGQPVERSFR